MIRALIFDFDGLILETEMPDYEAWQGIYREQGADLPFEVWGQVIGSRIEETTFDPVRYLEQQIGRSLDGEAINNEQKRRSLDLVLEQRVLPGVEGIITEARQLGLKLGIASSSPLSWVGGHLDRLGLRQNFEVIKTSDDVEHTKPDPALYLAALMALGVRADEAVVFEDSPNGVTAAKRAGLFVVAIPTELTAQLDLSHANLRATSLAEIILPDLLTCADGHS